MKRLRHGWRFVGWWLMQRGKQRRADVVVAAEGVRLTVSNGIYLSYGG